MLKGAAGVALLFAPDAVSAILSATVSAGVCRSGVAVGTVKRSCRALLHSNASSSWRGAVAALTALLICWPIQASNCCLVNITCRGELPLLLCSGSISALTELGELRICYSWL